MPEWKSFGRLALALALLTPTACSHGNNDDNGSRTRSNIDLTVTNFAVAPGSSDTEDPLTLTGTIQNLGTETANPMQGDSFKVYFNLSQDGTIELNEQGFLQAEIKDPIPAGGSLPFSFTSPFGNGDTLSVFGNFCSSLGCVPPETGVIGVKVDGEDVILELDEGNNFQFVTHEVVGTRVAAAMSGCDIGLTGGCNLIVSDGMYTKTLHLPCSGGGCSDNLLLPNELHRVVNVAMELVGCTSAGGICGWGVTITGETQKPGLPTSKVQRALVCQSIPPLPPTGKSVCGFQVEIRDADY